MVKLGMKDDKYSILTVDDTEFVIPKDLGTFLVQTHALNEENIQKTVSKNGIITLKIKSLEYSVVGSNKISKLNIYKSNKNNQREVIKMKVLVRFINKKNEDGTIKRSKFASMVLKQVLPVVKDKEFDSLDDIRSAVSTALDPLKSDNSTWVIEDNTKQIGLVVKNEYKTKSKNGEDFVAKHIFFVNVVPVQ